jgi:hypothetical protein
LRRMTGEAAQDKGRRRESSYRHKITRPSHSITAEISAVLYAWWISSPRSVAPPDTYAQR